VPRARGINPPVDVRHRALRCNSDLQMRVDRDIEAANRSLARSRAREDYLGANGATRRLGRAVALRSLSNARYDRERRQLRHKGAYLPIILEACQEEELAYEYRDGANPYGAFTFSLVRVLRDPRRRGAPTFTNLAKQTADRLQKLGYQQTPALVGPRPLLGKPIPWKKPGRQRR